MYNHILIPTDGSPLSSDAVDRSLAFAKDAGAKVTVLMATEPFHIFAIVPDQIAAMRGEYEREVSEHARRHLAAAEQKAKALGVSCDTLVVETTGFRDDVWLDINGSPLTDAAKTIERFRRMNYGSLEIEITVDDPNAYTKPWTVKVNQRILLDSEMIEFICGENERDVPHLVGK